MTQKELVTFLDTASSRAELVGLNPATSRQSWFLAGLMVKHGPDCYENFILGSTETLTKSTASELISELLND